MPPHVGKSPPTTSSPQTAADRCVQGTVRLRDGGQEGRLFGGDGATECCERSEPGDVMGAEPPSKGSFGMRPEGAITKVRFSSLRTHRSENEESLEDFVFEAFEKRRLPTLPLGVAVPSALVSLTSLFGMGRGGSSPL